MKNWNVRVHKPTGSIWIGTVGASSENSARCCALAVYGLSQEELDEMKQEGRQAELERKIWPHDEFDVSVGI